MGRKFNYFIFSTFCLHFLAFVIRDLAYEIYEKSDFTVLFVF